MGCTALVTCAGSAPAVAIIQALREQPDLRIRVIAVDQDPRSAGFHLSDRTFAVPPASDPRYMARLLEICSEEKVDVVFPVIDEELLAFAEQRSRFAELGARVITNDPDVIRLARDKYRTYRFCLENDIPAPRTALADGPLPPDLRFPLIIKPRTGRGSLHTFRVENPDELAAFSARVPNAIVQEFISGTEYTIDILTDFEGKPLSVVPRERIQTKAGMSVKGRTVKDPRLLEFGERVARLARLSPRGNIQCIDREKTLFLIEINPKFAAALPLTVAAGVNMPLLLVRMHLGERPALRVGDFEDNLVMIRYWQEIFVRG